MHRSRGFTLIEIMVALAVLALSGIALLSNINQATRDLARLEDKRVALNLAEYQLNTLLLQQGLEEIGRREEWLSRSGREWRVTTEITQTDNEKVYRIDVFVSPRSASGLAEPASVLLSGFRSDAE